MVQLGGAHEPRPRVLAARRAPQPPHLGKRATPALSARRLLSRDALPLGGAWAGPGLDSRSEAVSAKWPRLTTLGPAHEWPGNRAGRWALGAGRWALGAGRWAPGRRRVGPNQDALAAVSFPAPGLWLRLSRGAMRGGACGCALAWRRGRPSVRPSV